MQDDILDEDDVAGISVTKRGSFRDVLLKSAAQINPHQLKAIYGFLSSSLPEFSPSVLSEDSFKYLISKAEIKTLEKAGKNEEPLYQRGVQNQYFTLVLQGKLEIQSGQEGFRSESGPFSYLGVTALKNVDFIPDFSAKVLMTAQVLRIKKKQYDDAVRMNPTITPTVRKPSPQPRDRRLEPKSFMESTDFVELRTAPKSSEPTRKGKSKPLSIALKDFKKNDKKKKEEKLGLIDTSSADDESGSATPNTEPESPFSAYRTSAAQAVLTAFGNGEKREPAVEEQFSSSV